MWSSGLNSDTGHPAGFSMVFHSTSGKVLQYFLKYFEKIASFSFLFSDEVGHHRQIERCFQLLLLLLYVEAYTQII
jgi:hypothetical protein